MSGGCCRPDPRLPLIALRSTNYMDVTRITSQRPSGPDGGLFANRPGRRAGAPGERGTRPVRSPATALVLGRVDVHPRLPRSGRRRETVALRDRDLPATATRAVLAGGRRGLTRLAGLAHLLPFTSFPNLRPRVREVLGASPADALPCRPRVVDLSAFETPIGSLTPVGVFRLWRHHTRRDIGCNLCRLALSASRHRSFRNIDQAGCARASGLGGRPIAPSRRR